MAGVKTFEELIAWQQARELKRVVYELTDRAACRREAGFRNQLRDAAAGPPAHIAEGFVRKRPRDFSRFLTIARASLAETENHLIDGVDRGLWKETELDAARVHLKRAVTAIAKLQQYLNNCDPDFGAPNP
jgi:four helix bundle protein